MGNQSFGLTVAAGGHVQLEIPETFRGRIVLLKPHPVLEFSPGICEHLLVDKDEHWGEDFTALIITDTADCVDGVHAGSFMVVSPF